MMTVDVVDKAGERVAWTVEVPGLLAHQTRLDREYGSVDDRLTVSGNPTHTGSARVAFKPSCCPNGKEMLDPGEDGDNTIEQQRRNRARQRQQK